MDYKKYWIQDNFNNIKPPNHGEYPEGWNPSEFVSEILKEINYDSILDFGCGYGRLCSCFSSEKYIGIDLNPYAIKKAQELHSKYTFQEIDIDNNYPRVDLVFGYTVFLHLDDAILKRILNRLHSSCQKYLIIGEILGREWKRPGLPPVFNRDLNDYIKLLEEYGFSFVKENKRPYKRYTDNPRFKGKNTNFSLLIFKKSTHI